MAFSQTGQTRNVRAGLEDAGTRASAPKPCLGHFSAVPSRYTLADNFFVALDRQARDWVSVLSRKTKSETITDCKSAPSTPSPTALPTAERVYVVSVPS